MFSHLKVPKGIFHNKKILDIGCGRTKLEGAIGLDQYPHENVDIVSDLETPLPFPDEAFDIIFANQVFEHIHNLTGLLVECHRILRPGGILLAHVPYFRSAWAHIDPTHVRSFTINSLDYYIKGTFLNREYRFAETSFEEINVYLDTEYPSTLLRGFFTTLALRYQTRFENSLLSFIYPFEQLTFSLRKSL